MEPIYAQEFTVTDLAVDRYGRMKKSMVLFLAQEAAGQHCIRLGVDYESLASRRLFWAVTRHRVQVTRLPRRGETIRVETWPMPTTRVAYPRSVVAFDEEGRECFRAISLWVLMDLDKRSMVLPGRSGVEVLGIRRGGELESPGSLVPRELENTARRTVRFTDLDRNGHMNNTRYLDWVDDLLPSAFQESHPPLDMTLCYLSEAREGEDLTLRWNYTPEGLLQCQIHRESEGKDERIFSARITC